MSSVHPRIIDQNATLRALHPMATDDPQYDEDWLQKLLFNHPDLLPIADIEPGFGKLIPLAREFPVSSGYIDVLYATANGSLCLVETKLWRNPEAHRTVLAQLLGYAEALSRLALTEFKAKVQAEAKRRGQPDALDEILKRSLTERDSSATKFEANLHQSLATGTFLLLIVGDHIRPEVVFLSDFLGTKPSLEFSLKLVEMNFYHLNGKEDWPVLAVPTVVGRSHEVTRAVVRIRYEEKKRPDVEVAATEPVIPSGKTKINLEVFLKSIASGLDNVFLPYLERWMAGLYTISWGTAGFTLRYAPENKPVTLFDAYSTYLGVINERWAALTQLPSDAYRAYREALADIPALQRTFSRNGAYVNYSDLSLEEVRQILEATDQLAEAWVKSSRT